MKLVVLASARVCSVAPHAASALMIFVAKGLSSLKAISRVLVALLYWVLATLTACMAAFAVVYCVFSAGSLRAALLGL